MNRKTITVGAGLLLAAALSAPAQAAPTNGGTLDLACDGGLPSGTIALPPNDATWAPAFPVANSGVFIPYELSSHAWFVPDGGGYVDFGTELDRRPMPRAALPRGECSFAGSMYVEDLPDLGSGTVMFEGTAKVLWAGGS